MLLWPRLQIVILEVRPPICRHDLDLVRSKLAIESSVAQGRTGASAQVPANGRKPIIGLSLWIFRFTTSPNYGYKYTVNLTNSWEDKVRSAVITLIAVLGLAGCTAPQPSNVKFGFEFAGPNTFLYPMATGVIVLKSNDARSEAFCEAILRNMQPVASIEAGSFVAQNIIRTRFLLKSDAALSISPSDPATSCRVIMAAYDFDNAAPNFLRQINAPTGIGPFLVGLSPNSNKAIIIDASDVANTVFDGIASKWEQAITAAGNTAANSSNNGTIWKSIFDIFYAAIQQFLPPSIVAGIKIVITTIQNAICPA
jgi:hypothetical protein